MLSQVKLAVVCADGDGRKILRHLESRTLGEGFIFSFQVFLFSQFFFSRILDIPGSVKIGLSRPPK
jgi:hypothetical protein